LKLGFCRSRPFEPNSLLRFKFLALISSVSISKNKLYKGTVLINHPTDSNHELQDIWQCANRNLRALYVKSRSTYRTPLFGSLQSFMASRTSFAKLNFPMIRVFMDKGKIAHGRLNWVHIEFSPTALFTYPHNWIFLGGTNLSS